MSPVFIQSLRDCCLMRTIARLLFLCKCSFIDKPYYYNHTCALRFSGSCASTIAPNISTQPKISRADSA